MSHYRVSRKPAVNPDGAWSNASYELTWAIEELTDREDLLVKIAPDSGYDDQAYDNNGQLILWTEEKILAAIVIGALEDNKETWDLVGTPVGHQHAGITFLELAVVEISPKLLPDDMIDDVRGEPLNFHPMQVSNRKRYPVVWGATVHEAAHANHSKWVLEFNKRIKDRKVTAQERQWVGASLLLEESRIEKKQITARPQDQIWLEAAGMHVAVDEYGEACKAVAKYRKEHPDADELKLSRYKCGRAAALALARVDSGSIFRNTEINAIEDIVRDAFGTDYDELRSIWIAAQDTEDDDLETMLELGHRWFDLTQDAGNDSEPLGVAVQSGGDSSGGEGDELSKALSDAADNSEKEASGKAAEERHQKRVDEKRNSAQSEAGKQRQAQQQASKTFGAGAGAPLATGHPVTGYRKPTKKEVSLARQTRIRLQTAYVPEKAVTKVAHELPPGRLSTWALHQRGLQRRAGIMPTATPYTYMERKHVTTPPLRVGIIQDVSGSQSAAAAAAVSGAWSLAKAANEIPDAKVAMVSFGNDVHSIIKPLTKVTGVPVINANAGTHHFLDSLRALEGELNLTRRGFARLVVILTDGEFYSTEDIQGRDAALRRLTECGVKILWLDTDGHGQHLPVRMPGLHISQRASGNYAAIPNVICHEAVAALTKK